MGICRCNNWNTIINANSVSGEVRLLPNFAATGNGISYEIEGFINTAMGTITGTKLTPVTSPLFIAKVTDKGNLVIAKRTICRFSNRRTI